MWPRLRTDILCLCVSVFVCAHRNILNMMAIKLIIVCLALRLTRDFLNDDGFDVGGVVDGLLAGLSVVVDGGVFEGVVIGVAGILRCDGAGLAPPLEPGPGGVPATARLNVELLSFLVGESGDE